MLNRISRRGMLTVAVATVVAIYMPGRLFAKDAPGQADAQTRARDRWENVIVFYGDEASGEWSLRIKDEDVHDRAWFEYLELWHFDRKEQKWEQLKAPHFAKAIVLPKDKTSDQPEKEQTLVELKEIEPQTAGIWWAKWKVDEIEGGTLMRVGSGRAVNHHIDKNEVVPDGMLRMVVPIDLNKSDVMLVPDPRVYCVAGGPGKPEKKSK